MIPSPVRSWLIERARLEPSLLEGPGYLAAVGEVMALAKQPDDSSLAQALDLEPSLADRLISLIAVPETWFFRYPHAYRLLTDHLTTLAARAAPVRMLSYGCATGEEPYSMAMTALHAGVAPDRLQVVAADRSARALEAAAAARFSAASFRGELPPWSAAYFEPAGERTAVSADVRRLTQFVQAVSPRDLGLSRSSIDVIFCRNVLIYLSADARRSMLTALKELLTPAGLLFVGHAEPLIAAKVGFRPAGNPQTFALEVAESPSATKAAPRPAPFRRPSDVSPPGRVAPRPDADLLDEARALADAGNTWRSESILSRLVARAAPSPAALELLGLVRLSRDDRRQARVCFERAVELEPDRPASLLQLAMLCEASGEARAAMDYWARVRQTAVAGGGAP